MRGGAAKLQGCFGRDRFNVGNTANAIRPEDFFLLHHGIIERLKRQFVNGKLLSTRESFRSQLLFPPASGIDGPGDAGLILARFFTWIAACLLMIT
jgi:hypothetical protein